MDKITNIEPTTYSQNHEDLIIAGFFPDLKDGFYVDIGANDPVKDSVTKIFYDSGWRGINVEPIPRLHKKLMKDRPGDINLNLGVSDKPGTVEFREYHEYHGLSTMARAMQEQYQEIEGNAAYKDFEDYEVPLESLATIFLNYKVKRINFLKVDVEGYEHEVLTGNNWSVYRPELICIEANHIIKDWRPLLALNKYHLVLNDGLNNYYLAEESLSRKKLFPFPKTLIAGSPVVNAQMTEKIRNLDWQVQHQAAEARVSIFQQEREFQNERYELHNRINILSEQLNQQNRLRKQISGSLRSIDKIIKLQIEKLRVSKPTIYANSNSDLQVDTLGSKPETLRVEVRALDFKNYYQSSIKKSTNFKDYGYKATKTIYSWVRSSFKFFIIKSLHTLKRLKKIGKGANI